MAGMSIPANSCHSCGVPTSNNPCLYRLQDICVYYSGSRLPDPNINTGDNFNVVLNKLLAFIESESGASLSSVGLIMPAAFIVANSPLTSNGTIIVTGAGSSSQYIAGNGALLSFPTNVSTFTNDVGYLTAATIPNGSITNTKLAAAPANTVKGNNTGSSATPTDLTATQVTAMLNVFSSTLNGLAPLSGGGTSNFLRADGSWSTPSGGNTPNSGLSLNGSNIILGQSVGHSGNPAALLANTELPLAGFNLGTSGTGTVVVGGSIANTTPPTTSIAVIFGDSITVGIGASPVSQRWSTLFCNQYGLTETNMGISGTYLENQSPIVAQNMVTRIASIPVKTSSHRWLIFAYGINDQNLNAPNYTTTNYISDYTTVLNAALAQGWTGASIILVAPSYIVPGTYASVMGFPVSDPTRHQSFITATQTVATTFGAFFANPYSVMAAEGAGLLISSDALHPNNGGHRVLAATVGAAVKQVYTNGQKLLVQGGQSEFSQIVLDTIAPLVTPLSILGVDAGGNVAPSNYLVGNQLRVNNQVAIGNGDFSAATGETMAIYGGSRTGYLRINESIPAVNPAGKSVTIGMFPNTQTSGLIDAYDATAVAALPLFVNWNGGHITLGGLTPGGNGERVIVNGTLETSTTLRALGNSDTTSGKGIELFYNASIGHVYVRDKDTPVTQPLCLNFDGNGTVLVGTLTDTVKASLQIRAGTTTRAPLQIGSGVLNTTATAGCLEFTSTGLFFTKVATRENIVVGNSGATAPTTTAGTTIVNFYGSAATNFLGDPNSWLQVTLSGTTFKIPLYT